MSAEAVNNIQGHACRSLFEREFNTKFIESSDLCEFFKINYITELNGSTSKGRSKGRSVNPIRCYALLGCHSLLIIPVHPVLDTDTDTDTVYELRLQYEDAPVNVTRITGTDCVPQHAYYYLIVKMYQLFLDKPTSKNIFGRLDRNVTAFITEQLNIGIQEGREFFENKIRVFLSRHSDFLKVTDKNELQDRINFFWDLLRSDKFKDVKQTLQTGVISTISKDDVKSYSLHNHVTVSTEARKAFEKTVYGFHVLVCIGDYVVSMSLDRAQLFPDESGELSYSFFNSEIILYMSSRRFMTQVRRIIDDYYRDNSELGPVPRGIMIHIPTHKVAFFECGCKTLALHWYNKSTGNFELTTNIKLPGRAEHIVSRNHQGQYYLPIHNFPSNGIRGIMIITGGILPTYDERRVDAVLDIQYDDTS
ncbi:hypothetical protein EBV26_18790, partial [bacterium]|nr:hypothetical protein [bacterium]